jgi:cation:H+ antiporter
LASSVCTDEQKVTALSTLWPMGGVLSGALLIAWATEVLSFFLSRGLAFAVLALLQVLPEFAVEAVITAEAAKDASNLYLVTANFTGANRLIVGLFLPIVFFMASRAAHKEGKRLDFVQMPIQSSVEVIALIIPTVYSFSFVLRGSVSLVDAVVLIGMYVTYLIIVYKLPPEQEGDEALPLVPRTIRARSVPMQKLIVFLFFLAGGLLLFFSIHPFYENTIALGCAIGIPTYFLFQWLAPLLSEFPELITIVYWGRTGRAEHGLTNAISSKVNQWTLLIAMIPIVYFWVSYRNGNGLASIPFDDAQRLEILLTAAQGLFAAGCFMNLKLHRWEAWTLLSLWAIQLVDPLIDPFIYERFPSMPAFFEPSAHLTGTPHPAYIREWVTVVYLLLTPFVMLAPRERWGAVRGFGHVWKEHFAKNRSVAAGEQVPAPRHD